MVDGEWWLARSRSSCLHSVTNFSFVCPPNPQTLALPLCKMWTLGQAASLPDAGLLICNTLIIKALFRWH